MELQQLAQEKSVVTLEDLPVANHALRRRFEMCLAKYQIEMRYVRRTPAGFLVGPIADPTIKTRLDHYRKEACHCHLLDVVVLDQYGSCQVLTDTKLCENRHLEDYPALYLGFCHYSKVPEMAQYLRSHVLGPAVQRRFGREDLEVQFRLFTGALSLKETSDEELRVAGYYDRPYGYMAELYAQPTEAAIRYFNLGPEHLIEAGHCLYQIGPDVFVQFSFRKVARIGVRLIAAAFFRSSGCKAALRDLDRWQTSYSKVL
jgi:hypothetical protein